MANPPDTITFRDFQIGDRDWLIEEHARLYARDEGFDDTFKKLVTDILDTYITTRDPQTERGWIAERDGQRIGCVFCTRAHEPDMARLRMLLVLPEARGAGLGQRLLDHCIDFARDLGRKTLYLWTHESHRAACALYAKNGFEQRSQVAGRSFGTDVVELEWTLDLT